MIFYFGWRTCSNYIIGGFFLYLKILIPPAKLVVFFALKLQIKPAQDSEAEPVPVSLFIRDLAGRAKR